MGKFKKEAKAWGKEFASQLFGYRSKSNRNRPRQKYYGAHRQYDYAQRWAKRHGFKK